MGVPCWEAAPAKRYNEYLGALIIADTARPSLIVSHRRPLDAAPDACKHADARGSEVILKPGLAAASQSPGATSGPCRPRRLALAGGDARI